VIYYIIYQLTYTTKFTFTFFIIKLDDVLQQIILSFNWRPEEKKATIAAGDYMSCSQGMGYKVKAAIGSCFRELGKGTECRTELSSTIEFAT